MAHGSFVTAINCMDGRTQLPVISFLKEKYGVDYVDSITEPGPIKFLARNQDGNTIASIRKRVAISVEKHGSGVIAIVGHHDCAGNPVGKETQLEQLEDSANLIKTWGYDVDIVKLWVDESWQVHEV
ncbi:MAG: hypothetical protein JSU69_11020 [Candidatus Zixiibacteriota bacterium]|nr:MAG: hypothetical protein JSU69_11020 [candidate division Zixibacteria bacterium]